MILRKILKRILEKNLHATILFTFSRFSVSVVLCLNYHFAVLALRTMRSESLLSQNQSVYKHQKCDAKQ